MISYNIEFTDTYGGEANYSWVKRATIQAPADISNAALMRRAKKEMGLSGVRGRVERYNGDTIEFRPYGSCTVLFITADY